MLWGNKLSAARGNTRLLVLMWGNKLSAAKAILVLMWVNKHSAARGNTSVEVGLQTFSSLG